MVEGLCLRYVVKCSGKSFEGVLRITDDGKVEIWWDRSVDTTQKMEHNRPNVVL